MQHPEKSSSSISVLAGMVIAAGASGVTVYLSPAYDLANDPVARPDPYTATMHAQYAEIVDTRFRAVLQVHDIMGEDLKEYREEYQRDYERLRQEMADVKEERAFRREVLGNMNRILQQLIENGKSI